LALYRSGRQTEALRACAAVRRLLSEEIGVSPGNGLRTLEASILAQDPGLDLPPSPASLAVLGERAPADSGVDPLLVEPQNPRRRTGAPPVMYARSPEGVNIAYQTLGDGPDLVFLPGFVSHLDMWWEPWGGRVIERLGEFARVIVLDKRGMGLSDRPPHVGLEQWLEDIDVVRSAAGAERPILFGVSAGGNVATTYAVRHPEQVSALILWGTRSKYLRSADYRYGLEPARLDKLTAKVERTWGHGFMFDEFCPSAADNGWLRGEYERYERIAAGPAAGAAFLRALLEIDVRADLPNITVPTLVLHAVGDRSDPIEESRYMSARIPHATAVEFDSNDHLIWLSDARDQLTDAVRAFVLAIGASRSRGRGRSAGAGARDGPQRGRRHWRSHENSR
jgi:pimeloyl-ACP methyl ester carboxylesterase